MTQDEVLALIAGERKYQQALWPGHKHSYQEYLIYIRDYLAEALHNESRFTGDDAATKAIVRKVAALCRAAVEENASTWSQGAYLSLSVRYKSQTLGIWLLEMARVAEQWLVQIRDTDGRLLWRSADAITTIYRMAIDCIEEHGAPARDIEGDLAKRQRTVSTDTAVNFVAPSGWKGCEGLKL